MRHGQGTFVAARAKHGQLAVHRERLIDELRQIARQAVGLGLKSDELHELLEVTLAQLGVEHIAVRSDSN
jgi:DNA-binding transcriptional regulator YhcF (GntR family)